MFLIIIFLTTFAISIQQGASNHHLNYHKSIAKSNEFTEQVFFISPYGNCSVETFDSRCTLICNCIKSYQNQINQIQIILSENVSKLIGVRRWVI